MLTMHIELLNGRYDAASPTDTFRPEWPPHPARAFCGLVASAKSSEEWAALRWLEQQSPPEVWAGAHHTHVRRSSYVVTNRRNAEGGSQFHPGRSNLLSSRSSAQPASARIDFVWRVDTIDNDAVHTLNNLASRMPYLGRSTGTVLADFDTAFVPRPDQMGYLPGPLGSGMALRVPYRGYIDMLQGQHESDRPAWEVGRETGYVRADAREAGPPSTPMSSPFSDMIVLRFVNIRPVGGLCALFTASLRRAVMAMVPDPHPPALHGHEPGTPHVAFLALPNVGSTHSNGDLLGLAIALPQLDNAQRGQILRSLPLQSIRNKFDLMVRGIGQVTLSYDPDLSASYGSTAERWSSASSTWTTATPVFFDRHPKQSRGEDAESFIADSCVRSGLPRPADVVVSRTPLIPGAATPSPLDLPDWLRKRMTRHVRLTFDTLVGGPVLVGAGRYLGLGLFAPDWKKTE